MIGLPTFLGFESSNNRAIVQGAGSAWKMSATDFLKVSNHSRKLARVLKHFTHSLVTQISQSAACYRFHSIE